MKKETRVRGTIVHRKGGKPHYRREHTKKYNAAEEALKSARKKGAGNEFLSKIDWNLVPDAKEMDYTDSHNVDLLVMDVCRNIGVFDSKSMGRVKKLLLEKAGVKAQQKKSKEKKHEQFNFSKELGLSDPPKNQPAYQSNIEFDPIDKAHNALIKKWLKKK